MPQVYEIPLPSKALGNSTFVLNVHYTKSTFTIHGVKDEKELMGAMCLDIEAAISLMDHLHKFIGEYKLGANDSY